MSEMNEEWKALFKGIHDTLRNVATKDDVKPIKVDISAIKVNISAIRSDIRDVTHDLDKIATALLSPHEQKQLRSTRG